MDHQRQGAYLRAMGIVPWRLASSPAQTSPTDHDKLATAAGPVNDPVDVSGVSPDIPEPASLQQAPANDVAGMDWHALDQTVAGCTRCALSQGRTQTVFGVGDRQARLMVIGEAPGAEEDRRGEPFVGRAGGLLDNMLLAMGQPRGQVFIANIVKCRPPGNRDPVGEEAAACAPYLNRQIELVAPEVILAVGRIAAQRLLETDEAVGRLRGRMHELSLPGGERRVPLVVTYHPAYLLRTPEHKARAWEDLKLAMSVLGGAV